MSFASGFALTANTSACSNKYVLGTRSMGDALWLKSHESDDLHWIHLPRSLWPNSVEVLRYFFRSSSSKIRRWFDFLFQSTHFFLTKSQSHRVLFTQLFLTLLMNALQQSLCFLEVTLLLGRRTPKNPFIKWVSTTWARTTHKKPKSSNLFYKQSTWFCLSHRFSTFACCFSCNRSTKALITSMASGNLFCSRLGKPCKYWLR